MVITPVLAWLAGCTTTYERLPPLEFCQRVAAERADTGWWEVTLYCEHPNVECTGVEGQVLLARENQVIAAWEKSGCKYSDEDALSNPWPAAVLCGEGGSATSATVTSCFVESN